LRGGRIANVNEDDSTSVDDDVDDGPLGRLFHEVRALVGRVDPSPAGLLSMARESFTWRTVDVDLLAALAYDSSMEEDLAGTRGGDGPRMLTFQAPGLTVELEVTGVAADRRRLLGQLVPPRSATVEVRYRGGGISVPADRLGRFAAADVPAGPVHLICRFEEREGPSVVETDWVMM
jgi:hypothetical protein